jgi:hypothetical protein
MMTVPEHPHHSYESEDEIDTAHEYSQNIRPRPVPKEAYARNDLDRWDQSKEEIQMNQLRLYPPSQNGFPGELKRPDIP